MEGSHAQAHLQYRLGFGLSGSSQSGVGDRWRHGSRCCPGAAAGAAAGGPVGAAVGAGVGGAAGHAASRSRRTGTVVETRGTRTVGCTTKTKQKTNAMGQTKTKQKTVC